MEMLLQENAQFDSTFNIANLRNLIKECEKYGVRGVRSLVFDDE